MVLFSFDFQVPENSELVNDEINDRIQAVIRCFDERSKVVDPNGPWIIRSESREAARELRCKILNELDDLDVIFGAIEDFR